VPVVEPEFLPSRTGSHALRATWLGHACYYVEFPTGLRVLFDPVFEERCSPFSWLGSKRYTPTPCNISDIPVIDVVSYSTKIPSFQYKVLIYAVNRSLLATPTTTISRTLPFLKSKNATPQSNSVFPRASRNGLRIVVSITLLSSTGGRTSISHYPNRPAKKQ
jgi:hypothetical protein